MDNGGPVVIIPRTKYVVECRYAGVSDIATWQYTGNLDSCMQYCEWFTDQEEPLPGVTNGFYEFEIRRDGRLLFFITSGLPKWSAYGEDPFYQSYEFTEPEETDQMRRMKAYLKARDEVLGEPIYDQSDGWDW